MLRALINNQIWLSQYFDKLLPTKFRLDGNQDFAVSLAPKYFLENMTIYDVGGGKNPYLSAERKEALGARVVGIDIDDQELDRAPNGSYDEVICTDITRFRGHHDGDLVICQALLEHVKDAEAAFKSLASVLKPGGLALVFVPSRNAAFARLNIILPQSLKKAILSTIYPQSKSDQGFPAYYDRCTPSDFKEMATMNDLLLVEERYYYVSSYFSFFFPAYLLWRTWILLFYLVSREQAAETFALVFRKSESFAGPEKD